MAGSSFEINWNDKEMQGLMQEVAARAKGPGAALKISGAHLVSSVQKNFTAGGRPEAWAPLRPGTLVHNPRGLILRRRGARGGLLGSINAQVVGGTVLRVGTNAIHAGTHQFGAKKGEYGSYTTKTGRTIPLPWGDIPARPFLVIQEEDQTLVLENLRDYLVAAKL